MRCPAVVQLLHDEMKKLPGLRCRNTLSSEPDGDSLTTKTRDVYTEASSGDENSAPLATSRILKTPGPISIARTTTLEGKIHYRAEIPRTFEANVMARSAEEAYRIAEHLDQHNRRATSVSPAAQPNSGDADRRRWSRASSPQRNSATSC